MAGGKKGKERKGKERKGKERKGKERKGKERKGKERTSNTNNNFYNILFTFYFLRILNFYSVIMY